MLRTIMLALSTALLAAPPCSADVTAERIALQKNLDANARDLTVTAHRHTDEWDAAKTIQDEKLRQIAFHNARMSYYQSVLPKYEKVEEIISKLVRLGDAESTSGRAAYEQVEDAVAATARTATALGLHMRPTATVAAAVKNARAHHRSVPNAQAVLVNVTSTVTFYRQALARERELQEELRATAAYGVLQEAQREAEPFILQSLPELLDTSGERSPLHELDLEESPEFEAAGQRALELLSR